MSFKSGWQNTAIGLQRMENYLLTNKYIMTVTNELAGARSHYHYDKNSAG